MSGTADTPLRLKWCVQCGYSLDAIPLGRACPECGTRFDASTFDLEAYPSRAIERWWIGPVVLAAGYVGVLMAALLGVLDFGVAAVALLLSLIVGWCFWRWRPERRPPQRIIFRSDGVIDEYDYYPESDYPWCRVKAVLLEPIDQDRYRLRLIETNRRNSEFIPAILDVEIRCSNREASSIREEIARRISSASRS